MDLKITQELGSSFNDSWLNYDLDKNGNKAHVWMCKNVFEK